MSNRAVTIRRLGLINYKEAWDLQEKIFKELVDLKIKNRNENTSFLPQNQLLVCEHPHVFTLGKSGKEDHLLLDNKGLKDNEADYYKINRGGDITYHGPGQLVVYPIFDLEQFFTDKEVTLVQTYPYKQKGKYANGFTSNQNLTNIVFYTVLPGSYAVLPDSVLSK